MSFRKIDSNTCAIARLSAFVDLNKRKRGEDVSSRKKAQNLFNQIRTSVVILKTFEDVSYAYIQKKTGVKPSTASQIVRKIIVDASNDESLEIIVCFVDSHVNSERFSKIAEKIADSTIIRINILKNNKTIWQKIAKKSNYKLFRKIVENIVKNHRDETHSYVIKWIVQFAKSHFESYDEEIRLKYCEWIIIEFDNEIIFIFIDETYIEIDEVSRKKQKCSRSVDALSEFYFVSQFFVAFIIMLWDDCCEDEFIERSTHCWILSEIEKQREKHKKELKQENLKRLQRSIAQQQKIRISDTKAYRKLHEKNRSIQKYNAQIIVVNNEITSRYRKSMKQLYTSKRLFKYEEFTRDENKDIDWFLYRKYILRSHLYPYYFKIVVANSGKIVYFVKNDVSTHFKTAWINERYRNQMNIRIVSHSTNSSNLHSIENVWSYIKDSLKEYDLRRNDVNEKVKEHARRIVLKKWKFDQQQAVIAICRRFRSKLKQCIKIKESNKFKS